MTNSTEATPEATDFPLHWQDPADAQQLWAFYGGYVPKPFAPIEQDFVTEAVAKGFCEAYKYFKIGQYKVRFFNGYYYESLFNTPALTPTEFETLKTAKIEPRIKQHVTQGLPKEASFEAWEEAWKAKFKAHLTVMEACELDQPLPKLLASLAEALNCYNQMYELHGFQAITDILILHEFEQFYQDLGLHEAIPPHHLLHNHETHAVRGNRLLWHLSRQILRHPPSHELFLTASPAEVLEQLPHTPAGQEILAGLQAYLAQHGKQSEFILILREPSWLEDPTPVILNLKAHLAHAARDFEVELAQNHQQGEQALAAVRAELAAYPQPIIEQFETLLTNAQKATYMLDEHTYWMELAPNYQLRQMGLAIGRELQTLGCLTQREDVFYLHLAEIRKLAENPTSQETLIKHRKAELASFKHLTPPPFIGAMPDDPPPPNPVVDILYAPYMTTGGPTENPKLLVGCAASPGMITGPVKVLNSMLEMVKLNPGDILVTAMTTPQWTPFFAHVAGIITESGGMLSHPAIVAREMGIPAVVGVTMVTTVLHDGLLVELNGTTGEIRILAA